ncbi:hypothetical protein [Catellicoccus marimammalium]|uniref:Uncharacterized protein n=1 Tax=Catellicoccus marimammalium M35/04/3 TaxID=1234409 RepID=K8ZAC4_9ENTE|nr:hypothetical protein [Catellicoccus marimammalium]EKU26977.1 hypothetical protein C683_0973 [Catellicoccus marimammalium M35/04/3]
MEYYSFLDEIEKEEMKKMADEIDSEEAYYTIQDALKNLDYTRLVEKRELIEKQIEKREDLSPLAQKYWSYKIENSRTQDTLRKLQYRISYLSAEDKEQLEQIKIWEKEDILQDDFFTKEEREMQIKTLQALIYQEGVYSFLFQRNEERKERYFQTIQESSKLIDITTFLSEKEKQYFISLLAKVETKAKMKEIVQKAKRKNYSYEEQRISQKKEAILTAVRDSSLEEKWIYQIQEAKYIAELEAIIEQLKWQFDQ